jgi:ZIP family zinc transporter
MDFVAWLFTVLSGLATASGGLLVLLAGHPSPTKQGVMLSFSSGVMLYMSLADLVPETLAELGLIKFSLFFSLGIVSFLVILFVIPKPEEISAKNGNLSDVDERKQEATKVAGLVTAVSLCMHNLPEGIGVYLSCLRGLEVGLPLALAIIIHVIPEGMAVSAPIYQSTNSKWEAMKWAAVAGACQPLSALVFGLGFANYLTEDVLHCFLAIVAGIMVLVSFVELIPTSLLYLSPLGAGISHLAGVLMISFSMYIVRSMFGLSDAESISTIAD